MDDLHLEVRGLGLLALPLPDAQARQLCRLAKPARYGRGEKTLLDRRVRDTWEIPTSLVKIDKRRWDKTLRPVIGHLRAAELPVTHTTTRTGRPYTLVLTKTTALFENEEKARRRDRADLAWLGGFHGR